MTNNKTSGICSLFNSWYTDGNSFQSGSQGLLLITVLGYVYAGLDILPLQVTDGHSTCDRRREEKKKLKTS